MNEIITQVSTPCYDSTKVTYKPLQDLKFAYLQKSHTTSVRAQVSTELPTISAKSAKKRDFQTKTSTYTNTINGALKMKLKLAQLQDEISLIDLKIDEDVKKFQHANAQHENFTKSFENFLTQQYEKVTDSLTELKKSESESSELKNKLDELQQQMIEKSLKLYDLESIWRKYKTSLNFLLHLSALLRYNKTYSGEFKNLRTDKTSSLDELMVNFKNLNTELIEFKENDFSHLTASKIMEFLSKLKRQNLKILRYKLHYQKLRDIFADTDQFLENSFRVNLKNTEDVILNAQEKTKKVSRNVQMVEKQYEILETKVLCMKEISPVHTFVEQLYEKCFKTVSLEKSHVQMVKCVEDYCHLLLCTLSSFDRDIILKAIHLSKS